MAVVVPTFRWAARADNEDVPMIIRALVFDLAGVLLDFGGVESVQKLSDGRISPEEFFRFWSEAKCAHDLHCGRCTPEHFAWQAVRELRLPVTSERFLAEYQTWLRGPYPGALEFVELSDVHGIGIAEARDAILRSQAFEQ